MKQVKFIIEVDKIRPAVAKVSIKFIADYIKSIVGYCDIEAPKDYLKEEDLK
jgi:hypothetical protein